MEREPYESSNMRAKSTSNKSNVKRNNEEYNIPPLPDVGISIIDDPELNQVERMQLEEALQLSEQTYENDIMLAVAKSRKRIEEMEQSLANINIDQEDTDVEMCDQAKRLRDLETDQKQLIIDLCNEKITELLCTYTSLDQPEFIKEIRRYTAIQLDNLFDIKSKKDTTTMLKKLRYKGQRLILPDNKDRKRK